MNRIEKFVFALGFALLGSLATTPSILADGEATESSVINGPARTPPFAASIGTPRAYRTNENWEESGQLEMLPNLPKGNALQPPPPNFQRRSGSPAYYPPIIQPQLPPSTLPPSAKEINAAPKKENGKEKYKSAESNSDSSSKTKMEDSKPKYPTVKVGGFFQADLGLFHQSPLNRLTVGDIQDGADFRRARLNAHGQAWDNVGYMIEMDFAFPGRPSFMDVYLEIQKLPLFGTLRVGQWRQPFGMDAMTSVRELTFLERALPFAFVPFRQIGAGFFDHAPDETMTWALSVFRFPTDAFGGNVGDDGGYALAGRMTWLPYDVDCGRHLVHLGAGYSLGDPANNFVRYRNQPEFFVGETGGAGLVPIGVPSNVPPFVDTGLIPTNTFNLFNAEFGAVSGSLYVQSEFYYAVVNQIAGPTLGFTGAYAFAGYFLTGEVRPYNRKQGVFGRVRPLAPFQPYCGQWGAWEVAARLSYINLDDRNILGNQLTDTTFGINWYHNDYTKFQFNWIHAFLDAPAFGRSDADIFAFRAQVDF